MTTGKALVQGFLQADGYLVRDEGQHLLFAERIAETGAHDRLFLWVLHHDVAESFDSDQVLLAEMATLLGQGKGRECQGFLIVPTTEGLGTAFRKTAGESYKVRIRSYPQFFDTPYKQDGEAEFGGDNKAGRAVAGIVQRFLDDKLISARVPQAFFEIQGFDRPPRKHDGDLYARLIGQMSNLPDRPTLRIITGGAGAGKSVLFRALFTGLYRAFMQAKREGRLGVRPILFLPEHIHQGEVQSVDGLIDQVLANDVAAGPGRALFQWLNDHGFATWMFDGLDEFFAGDPEFLNMIEGKLAASAGAQVLICARSSLLTTSEDLRALIERQFGRGSANIEIYELAPWTRAQQRFLATLRFTGAAPAADGKPSPRSDAFIAELNRLPAASQLATNAYYADLLVEEFKSRNGSLSDDEFALLDHAVDGLIDREHGKLVFDWDVFMSEETFLRLETAIDGFDVTKFQNASERAKLEEALTRIGRGQLRELLQSIAHLARVEVARPSESGGLSVADLLALGEVYTDQTLDKALEQRVLLSIVQFAFFGPGRERGTIRFTHELLADYLAGCHAVHLILDSGVTPEAVGQAVGVREDFANTLVLRYLVQALEKNAALRTEVIAVAESAKIKKRNQRNARVLAAALAGELLPGRNAGR